MKSIILIAMFALCTNANAQITLEQVYDSASTYISLRSQLMVVKFEESGERYVRINKEGKIIDIYDLNHSLIKSISYAGFPQSNNNVVDILFLSENLFNTDSKIEFMYVYSDGVSISTVHTRIYNEDGSLIFQKDSMAPLVLATTPQFQIPIYNTSQGTKMILSHQCMGQAKVYSLPGTLSTSIAEANGQFMQTQNGAFSNLYPNPGNGAVTLQYELPEGEREGELILYNMQGVEIKRYKVDNTFNDVLIDNTQLQAGTYFYQLQTSKGAVGTKKMIVVK